MCRSSIWLSFCDSLQITFNETDHSCVDGGHPGDVDAGGLDPRSGGGDDLAACFGDNDEGLVEENRE